MLRLQDVSASYGRHPVLRGATLHVAAGEICAVLEANGAGKTTLLRSVMGLVPSVTGSIEGPAGQDLRKLRTAQIARCGVAYVPEGRGILNSLTVAENLLLGATPLRSRGQHATIREQMDRVTLRFPILKERLGQRAGLLSGGEQQMLAIGRALMSRPQVLLLDEPSLGLAPVIRQTVADLLKEIVSAEGLAVLLVEQDVSLAQRCASRGYLLKRGEVVAEGDTASLLGHESLKRSYLGSGPAGVHWTTR